MTAKESKAVRDWKNASSICANIICILDSEKPTAFESECLRYWENVRNVAYGDMPQEARDKWEKLYNV